MIFLLAGVEVWHWLSSLFERRKTGFPSMG
jgi:hypothetical protein